ncbi:hypothetical protein OsJ_20536 [Oryza sativa Japonica Group]|uniref:Uncharacterized protein n=1 Tax=Oryza sativa subsp. japonica TaxID=39947 RepID=B9FS38_ORYSJ|nr:hypothetical protein OsJ_20536 [Oryza sativa Japonica Group]
MVGLRKKISFGSMVMLFFLLFIADISKCKVKKLRTYPVCALLSGGKYAEKVVVLAGQLLLVPEGVSLTDAAGLLEVACTIWSTAWRIVLVCALLSGGKYAEKVVVLAGQLLLVPEGVSLTDAAGLLEVACTIWSTAWRIVLLRVEGKLLGVVSTPVLAWTPDSSARLSNSRIPTLYPPKAGVTGARN